MPEIEGSWLWMGYVWPVLATVFLWWGSTGLIAWLVGRPLHSYPRTITFASLIALCSILVVVLIAEQRSLVGAWAGFLAGLGLWGWLEVTFLTGVITGPHLPRTQARRGVAHALDAVRAILWHELAIIAVVGICAVITWQADNRTALHTLLLLWVMRSSAKLNLFLGVRNLGEVFMPRHLQHLLGFMRTRPMNLLFPISMVLGSALTGWLFTLAWTATEPFAAAAFSMLATLSALAMLEHALMVLPLPAEALWRWSLGNRRSNRCVVPGAKS